MRGHEGKIAVVTGAAKGIGRAYAERLAVEGVDIVAVDLEDSAETLGTVRAAGRRGLGVIADVSSPDDVAALARTVEAELGRCDILVNNAGIYPIASFEEITFVDWKRIFEINLDSMFLLCQEFVPGMRARGWGRIVNQASATVNIRVTGFVHYVSTKAAIVGFTRALASELGNTGITVNAISPTLVRTPGTEGVRREEEFAAVAELQAIQRVAVPEDLAGALAFLTSDEAAFITAQTYYVDGGIVRV